MGQIYLGIRNGEKIYTEVDDEYLVELYLVCNSWHYQIGKGNSIHVYGCIKGKNTSLHRYIGNKIGLKGLIDHIDRNTLNNLKSNLRECTQSQNGANRKILKNNKSGYKGVSYHKGNKKYHAYIRVNRKGIFLEIGKTPEEAHEAYKQAAIKYFGEFACFK